MAGGGGAGPGWNGESGIHSHMTNTRITDPEVLERRYPVLLRQFILREGSGGNGRWNGGDGIVREFEFLKPLQVSILSERRVFAPFGMFGGEPGKRGVNLLIKKGSERVISLGGKSEFSVQPGDRVIIMSPGGGGFGAEDGQNSHHYEHEIMGIAIPLQKVFGSEAEFRRAQEQA